MRRIIRIIPNKMVSFIYVSRYQIDNSFVLFLLVSDAIGLIVKQLFISKNASEYDKTMWTFGIEWREINEIFFPNFK